MKQEVLCIGEVLWDALPAGLFPGGAPFNVAYHLHALGERVALASSVGDDALGREVRRRIRRYGMDESLVQTDPELPTGFVEVSFDAEGMPSYVIVAPAAWDRIVCSEALVERARSAAAIVFGSLAQRDQVTRQTICAIQDVPALKVFDINLRPPFIDRSAIEQSMRTADLVKLNEDELTQLQGWFGLPDRPEAAAQALTDLFACRAVCVTRGERGAALLIDGCWHEHPGFRVASGDPVGAGDAFLAALLSGMLAGMEGDEMLDYANRLGAYVASRPGATPDYEGRTREAFRCSTIESYENVH